MKKWTCAFITLASFALLGVGDGALTEAGPTDFTSACSLDVYVEINNAALAAYQFEMKILGDGYITGVDGGNHRAFSRTPYYDPAAVGGKRIIVADFNTGSILPTRMTRVATVHVKETGDEPPVYEFELTVAASPNGRSIPASIVFERERAQASDGHSDGVSSESIAWSEDATAVSSSDVGR